MREYGKVHSTFWSSQTVASLSDDGKMLALYLMTCSHNTIAGVFRLPDGYASEDLGWTSERVVEGFRELFAKGFANRCGTTKWVLINKHLEWNPPENPNQRKSVAKMALSIPDECAWKPAFMRDRAESLGLEPPEKENGFATLQEPFLNQEQEQEQEQETSRKARSPAVKKRKSHLPDDWTPKTEDVSKLAAELAISKSLVTGAYVDGFRDACQAKGYEYLDFDAAFRNCVRQDWPKLRAGRLNGTAHADPFEGAR